MASTIKIKRSSVAGKSPTTSDISAGELALNIKDQKLYSSNGSAVFEIGGGGGGSAANGFSGILVGSNVVVADSSTDRLTITAGTRINIAANPTTDTITFSASTNDYLQVANATSLLAAKATWAGLTSTNTALRTLISDRLQVANASSIYQTKAVERAALANTNSYIATKLNSSSYTASDVLSKLITVDGAGSGLDADLLDGQSSAYFAVAATENSRLANTNAYIATKLNSSSYTEADVRSKAALANTNAYIATKLNSSSYTASDVLSKLITVDGTGSGLDADTLDGLEATSFVKTTAIANLNMANYNIIGVNNLEIGDPGPSEGISWAGGNLWKIYESPNDLTTNSSGNLQIVQNATRRATFNTSGQLELPVATGTAPLSVSSTTVVTNLNADLLDGLDSGQFLRSDVDDTVTSVITVSAADPSFQFAETDTTTNARFILTAGDFWIQSGASGSGATSSSGDIRISGYFGADVGEFTVRSGGANQTVWHAGNDGSGSGLDADLWDGNQFASYLNQAVLTSSIPSFTGLSVTNTITGYVSGAKFSNDSETKDDITTRTESGFFQTSSGTTGEGWPITNNGWQHLISVTHSNDTNYYAMQIAGSFNDNVFYGRKTNGSGSASWVKFWTDGNDGSGSGLDADLLDGLDSGQFMRDDASATNTVDLRAPIFYDSNDTSVYLDGGALVLRSASPTIYFRDTDHNSAMIHVNSNYLYILRGGNDTTSAAQVNSQWPLYINLTDNNATFGGSISAIGNITAYASDIRLKENIVEIPNAIEKIKKIRGVTFDWKDTVDEVGFTPDTKYNDLGVIAQEIQAVIPQAVVPAPFDAWVADPRVKYSDEELAEKNGTSKSGENYLTVNLEKIVPLLIEGIKEQQSQIEVLRAEINILKGVN